MKRMLIPALEELNPEEEFEGMDEEIEMPESIEESMLLTMEFEEEVNDGFENIDQTENIADDVEGAIERLENIAGIIEKHGISSIIMQAADPYRELVDAGICVAYEELSDEIVNDETSQGITEVIYDQIEATENLGIASIESKVDDIMKRTNASDYAGVGTAAQGKISKIREAVKGVTKPAGQRIKDAGKAVAGGAKSAGGAIAKGAKAAGGYAATGGKAVGRGAGAGYALAAANPVATAVIIASAAAIAALSVVIAKSMSSHEGTLRKVNEKLSGISSFDEEKFKSMDKKVLSKQEFSAAVKGAEMIIKTAATANIVKIAESIESAISSSGITVEKVNDIAKKAGDSLKPINNDTIKSIFGLEIVFGDAGVQSVKSGSGVIKSKGNLGQKGWSASDAKSAVDASLKITAEGKALIKSVKSAASATDKVARNLAKKLKAEGVDRDVAKAAVRGIRSSVSAYKDIVKVAVKAIYKLNATSVQVAKAAISSAA